MSLDLLNIEIFERQEGERKATYSCTIQTDGGAEEHDCPLVFLGCNDMVCV